MQEGFNPFLMAAWYVVFVFSATLHEAAHAFTSWKLGDPTAYQGGQVTLDPRPHIRREKVGMIWVPIISFMLGGGWMIGWASAPYNASWAWRYPRRSAWMALAGPASNLLLFALAFVALRIGLRAEVFSSPGQIRGFHTLVAADGALWGAIAAMLSILMMLNLILMVFNLLPVPPLDGSGAMPLLLSDSAARRWMELTRDPRFAIGGLIVAWLLFGYLIRPIFAMLLMALHPGMQYVPL